MTLEEAREAARSELTSAISKYLAVAEMMDPEEELVNHWALVVHVMPVQEDGMSHYARVLYDNNAPTHVTRGLFAEALRSYDLGVE